jgi:membrane protease YdiL (CAAX protease family)
MGLHALPAGSFLKWTAGLTLVSFGGIGVMALLERTGWWPQEPDINRLLLPETTREKVLALLLVAPSAGFCEELLYRGYLLPQLSRYFSSTGWGWVGSSLAFGLAHSYQGVSGALQAALLGALLAYPVVKTGSVYPSMAAHFLIDAILLMWLGRKLLGPTEQQESKIVHDENRSLLAPGPDTGHDAGNGSGSVNVNGESDG